MRARSYSGRRVPRMFTVPSSPGRGRTEKILRSPREKGEVLDDEDHAEGGDELEELRCLVHPPEDQELDDHPDGADGDAGEKDRGPETERAAEMPDEGVGDIGAQHVERAVREVHDPGDPEDDGEPRRDQEQGRRAREAGQRLHEVEPEVTHGSLLRRAFDAVRARFRRSLDGAGAPARTTGRPGACGSKAVDVATSTASRRLKGAFSGARAARHRPPV